MLIPDFRRLVQQEGDRIGAQISALQAIDWGWKDSGKIIIVAKVGKCDIVKIIEIRPMTTMHELKSLVGMLKMEFGASVTFFDGPYYGDDFPKQFLNDGA